MKNKNHIIKISETTLTLLKNFASINNSILVKQGNRLRTISVGKNILAETEVSECFPREFAIYDLNQFLNGLNLYQDPEFDFSEEKYLSIREGNRRVKYFFAEPHVIISPPDKEMHLPSDDVSFKLDNVTLEKLLKASSVYQLPDLSVTGESGVIRLLVKDKRNDTSNEYSIVVGETDKQFTFNFKVENIRIIPGSYDVNISNKLLSKFTNSQYNLSYWIALEPDSII